MAQIKETIELLSKILRYNGMSKIKCEVFRQAKFNKDEATGSMWKLLFEVIYYLKYRKIEDITVRGYSELTSAEICMYVKTEMKMRGFVSRAFHELPNDMSAGSRELLLAFGWLMCRSGLVEMFMEQCCTFLDGGEVEGDLDGISSLRRAASLSSITEKREKIAYLMWLNRKLQMSLRNINTLELQKERLTQRVHNLTRGVSVEPDRRDYLTVLEVMMLKNPELLKKNLKLLETDNQRLDALISWQSHDDIFWKWMESVLDVKIAECGYIEEIDVTITPRTQSVKMQLDNKLQLTETLQKYEDIVSQLEDDILNQGDGGRVSMQTIDDALAAINTEIVSHLDVLMPTSASSSSPLTDSTVVKKERPALPRVRKLQRESSTASSVTSVSAAEREISTMESELSRLQELVERLQADIDYKEAKYHDDLSSMTSGVESLCEPVSRVPPHFRL